MKLQVALDGNLDDAITTLRLVEPYVDIAEIGTPLIYREGMHAVRQIRETFPNLTLLADLKIMDAGEEEATIAFEAGCDIVTVLGVAQDATVRGVVKAARSAGKQILADLIQVADPVARGRELLVLGCDYLCVHTGYDAQRGGDSPLETLSRLRHELGNVSLAVAGGINTNTIDAVAALQPEIIIVGGAITRGADPAAIAHQLRERLLNP